MGLFPFRRLISLKNWLIPIMISCFSALAAQNGPICFNLAAPMVSANPGDTVYIPMRVRDFDQIVSMQFVMFFNPEGLKYLNVDLSETTLPGIVPQSFFNGTSGSLSFAWSSLSGNPMTLPDSSVLFRMSFVVQPGANGYYPITVSENNHTIYEIIQEGANGYTPIPLSYQMGGVGTSSVAPGSLYLAQSCVQNTGCNLPNGSASLIINGGMPPYQYSWVGPSGFSANTFDISGLAGGIYQLTVTDQIGNSIVIIIQISSPLFNLTSSIQTNPAVCGANNGCAYLTIAGNPPFFYEWSSGNVNINSPNNCELPPGNYSVSVSNLNNCLLVEHFSIENDTTFSVWSDWAFIEECGGTGELTVSVADANGPFSYQWSNGATSATINQLQEGLYSVTVSSTGGCTAVAESIVVDISTQSWAAELQEDCGQGIGSLFINYNPAGNLSFPVLFSWSDGTTHQRHGPVAPGILDSLQDVPSGHYNVTITDANGCELSLERTMNCFQPPPVPDGFNWCYIDADDDPSDNCTGVYARHFQAITTLNLSIQYPNGTALEELKNLQLPGLSLASFTLNATDQTLGMTWQSATPLSLPDNQLLFEVCLIPGLGQVGGALYFVQTPVPAAITTQDGPQIFLGRNGWIDFGMTEQPAMMACKAQGVAAACAADGKAQILLGSCTPGEKLYGHYILSYPDNSTEYFGDLSGLRFSDGGVYQINIDRPDFSSESWLAVVPPITPMEECVWPGDADNNQAVNHHDLLYIGLAYGASGPIRANASLNWTGQDAGGWTANSAVRQINFKNIDTNGDGQINAADTLALVQNWGKVINTAQDNPFDAPLKSSNPGQSPSIILQTDTLYPGDAVHMPLLLGSQSTPLENIYGLAFSISYDPNVVKDNIRFTPSPSWFGNEGNYLCVQKNFPRQGRLDVAITRTDGVPVSGWGEIGDVFIIIEDNIFGQPDPLQDSIKNSKLFFSAISSSDFQESPKDLGAAPVDLVIKKSGSVHTQEPLEHSIILAPNPAQDFLSIRSTTSGIRALSLLQANGGLQETWYRGEPVAEVTQTLSHLPAGVYFVKIQTENGVVLRKVVIRHK
jgi:hypothetical protein